MSWQMQRQRFRWGGTHHGQYFTDGPAQADKDRSRDDRVAGVECFQMRHGENAGRLLIIEAVTGVDTKAEFQHRSNILSKKNGSLDQVG